ncbi:WD40-repeat-containing domain protein [Gamsiella multidivaricata]|uniref:WD40-repeat-containing domain protein n=1 Tax=Gamsiella multidivaricata TaxID=101098 RepID=UPI00221F03C3|nr:WD40-repeat-containing domain protein [Gamsiella multidivaricata]KAI7823887.1 WD40-repeat-containing domain protein [Gamsiella multidivaricata]
MDTLADGPQVQVKFVTQQRQYAIPETSIQTPARLRRYGLSQIINLVLQNEGEKQRPFDFLIEGEFLRTSLAEYLEEKNMSTENVLTIEYVESMLPPTPLSSYEHDDWVSAVQAHHSGGFLTGSYDNHVRLWNKQAECTQILSGHSGAIKAVQWLTSDGDNGTLLSGALDRSILAWEYNHSDNSHSVLYECRGHTAGIESITLNVNGDRFATGSADSMIKIWTTTIPTVSDHIEEVTETRKKRRTAKEDRILKAPILTLAAHTGPVSAVVFSPTSADTLYSGGWDHSVRVWDVENHVNVTTKNCEKVVHALDYSQHSGLLATGHADPTVRLWDPRSEDSSVVKQTLVGHQNWVTSVSWSPSSSYMLASGSYDGLIKVWDIRAKGALYTLSHGKGSKKVFSIDWNNDILLSGGEDNQMKIHKIQDHLSDREEA